MSDSRPGERPQGRADDCRGHAGAFFKTSPRLATPDIQIHFIPFPTDKIGEKLHSFSSFTASVCQLRPESRGSPRIKSADPPVPPEIRINYLATETDRRAFIDGLKILRKILAAPALKYCAGEVYPGSNVTSDEDLLEFCRQTGSTAIIRPRPAEWATIRSPWSVNACGCAASRDCAWSMPQSCPT